METTDVITPSDFSLVETCVVNRIQQVSLDRRLQGPINPECCNLTQLTYDGVNFSKKYLDLTALILLCWYGDVFKGFEQYVLYEIRTYLERNRFFAELAAACTAKEVSLMIIILFSKKYSEHRLFSTILAPDRIERVVNQVRLRFVHPHRPKRKIRHRGYRDHGSLRPEHEWKETHDWTLTEKQLELEQQRTEYHDLIDLYVHTAGDLVLKSFSTDCKV